SMPKCTVGIKESISELKRHDFVKKGLLQEMILSHYFSKGGSFYQTLYNENLIDQSFYYETNLDRRFGYSIIGGNIATTDQIAKKLKELLLTTKKSIVSNEDIERMKDRKSTR